MNKKAFTLIELSIVLIIMGLLIGGSFKVFQSMHDRAKVTRAKDDVKTAKNAILGYAEAAKILPSLADFNQTLSPIKSNQHQLFYKHDTNLTNNNICASVSTILNVKRDTNDGNSVTIKNVAFILVSESANHNLQTKLTKNSDTNYTVEIHKPYSSVDDEPTPVNRVEPYDDIADWVTLPELQEAVHCNDNPFRIVNTSLPNTNTNDAKDYKAVIVVDGNYSDTSHNNDDCKFKYNGGNDHDTFTYNGATFTITATNSTKPGTVEVDCNITADGKYAVRKFVITVNDSNNSNNGNNSNTGSATTGSSCTTNSDCASGICLPILHTCS